jgi:hypothetical protein
MEGLKSNYIIERRDGPLKRKYYTIVLVCLAYCIAILLWYNSTYTHTPSLLFCNHTVADMAAHLVADSQPGESSQRYNDYTYEATQLSQPRFETQNTQGSAFANSQVEPRRKYCAYL